MDHDLMYCKKYWAALSNPNAEECLEFVNEWIEEDDE